MAWPDLRKQVFAYILNRLKLFSNVSSDQLEVSLWTTSKLSLKDVALDTERIEIPGIHVRSAVIDSIVLELSTQGVKLRAEGLSIVAAVNRFEPELALSVFLDQATSDMANSFYETSDMDERSLEHAILGEEQQDEVGLGGGDASGVVARIADMALSQLHVSITQTKAKLILADEIDVFLEVQEVTHDKGLLKISSILMSTTQQDDSMPSTPKPSVTRNEDLKGLKEVTDEPGVSKMDKSVRFAFEPSESPTPTAGASNSSTDDEDDFGEDMSASVYFDSSSRFLQGDMDEQSDEMLQSSWIPSSTMQELRKSIASLPSGVETAPVRILWIDRLAVAYSVADRSVRLHTETVRINVLPFTAALVECLNIIFRIPSSPQTGHVEPYDTTVSVGLISMGLGEIDSNGSFVDEAIETADLEHLLLKPTSISLSNASVYGLALSSPVFTVTQGEVIEIVVPHPISLTASLQDLGYMTEFSRKVLALVGKLEMPKDSASAPLKIELPEIRVQIGDITLLFFPGAFTAEGLNLNEIQITAGMDRILLSSINMNFGLQGDVPSFKVSKLGGVVDQDLLAAAFSIIESIPKTKGKRHSGTLASSSFVPNALEAQNLMFEVSDIDLHSDLGSLCGKISGSYSESRLQLKAPLRLTSGDNTASGSILVKFSSGLSIECHDLITHWTLSAHKDIPSSSDSQSLADSPEQGETPSPSLWNDFATPFPVDVTLTGDVVLNSAARLQFSTSIELNDQDLIWVIPKVKASLIDSKEVDIGILHHFSASGSFKTLSFDSSVKGIVFSSCADSTVAMMQLFKTDGEPLKKTPVFTVDPPETKEVLDGIDWNAFRSSISTDGEACDLADEEVPANMTFIESYYHTKEMPPGEVSDFVAQQVLDLDLTDLAKSRLIDPVTASNKDEDLAIQDDYIRRGRSTEKARTGQSTLSVSCTIERLGWHLHDGYDFAGTRETLERAVRRVEKEAANLSGIVYEDQEEPLLGDFMYNSIYIGSSGDRGRRLQDSIDETLGSSNMGRSKAPKSVFKAVDATVSYRTYMGIELGDVLSRFAIALDNFVVEDKVPTSAFDIFFGPEESRERREIGRSMLNLEWQTIVAAAPEVRALVEILPLRFFIDQDTLDFLTRFFTFEPKSEIKSERPVTGAQDPELEPFIQRLEVADVPIKVDYKPKRVDYTGLRSGRTAEFMNLFALEGSSLLLRHIIVRGVSGFTNMWASLGQGWAPDIRDNQLADILWGLSPVQSVAKLGVGFRQLLVIPVRESRDDGESLTGLQRGTLVFARSTAAELYKLGLKMAKGSHGWLQNAERVLGGGGATPERALQ